MFNYVNGITNHSGAELHPISHCTSEHVTLCLVGFPFHLQVDMVESDCFHLVRKMSWENDDQREKDFVEWMCGCYKQLTFFVN